MATDATAALGEACFDTYKRLHHETLAFMQGRIYLLTIDVAALQGIDPIKPAHEQFVSQLKPHYESPYQYFVQRAYISLVASFELFLQDILAAVITANPKKIGQVEFKLSEILDAAEQSELVRRAIEATLNKLMYKKPLEYLDDMASLLSIDPAPLRPHWPAFVEAKARRDLGVHNGWRCNAIYIRKVVDAGLVPAFAEGDMAYPSDEYLESVSNTFDTLSSAVVNGIVAKHLT